MKKTLITFLSLVIIFAISSFVSLPANLAAYTNQAVLPTLAANDQTGSIVTTVKNTLPTLVTIVGTEKIPQQEVLFSDVVQNNQLLQQFGIDFSNSKIYIPTQEKMTSGSGFIVSHNGYILTNNHVVDNTNASYTVSFYDGTQKNANVVYKDATKDVAVIKVEGDYPQIASLGDSSNLKVGQIIASFGNAYGRINNSVSLGAVSALNSNIIALDGESTENLKGLIESSAQVVPGYSGGPVIDLNGNVVAMNVATAGETSYLIPINTVKKITSSFLS